MGTDIHMVIEYKQSGKWNVDHDAQFDDYRNYDAFAILACVRNGYGFAGCPTGEGFQIISKPKGVPSDISFDPENPGFLQKSWHRENDESEYVQSTFGDPEGSEFWLGDHSFSWLTLKEFQEFDFNQKTVKFGVVSEAEYVKYRKNGNNGSPDEYYGGVSGYGVKTVTRATMDAILDGKEARETIHPNDDKFPYRPEVREKLKPVKASYYVQVEWMATYKETATLITKEIIPALERTAKKYNLAPENVRVVFGFDS